MPGFDSRPWRAGHAALWEIALRQYRLHELGFVISVVPVCFTGQIGQIPCREMVELPLTIDEALRFIVSGGVIKLGMIIVESVRIVPLVNSRTV